jgi:uncharacterized protein (TIGR00297 family)
VIIELVIGFVFGVVIGGAAWRARALSLSGAVGAAVVGGLIFGFGGLAWAVQLLTFFISSSLLSRAFQGRKAELGEKFAKGSRRDWGQVAANGGLGAGLAVLLGLFPDNQAIFFAYVGAMAAVNADTWSTELGVLSPTPPRLVTSGRIVERGASGGVTTTGTLSALGGAALLGFTGGLFVPLFSFFPMIFSATLGGLSGGMFDSLLGATVQGIYYCPRCEKETEQHPVHHCGTETTHLRGWRWLNNDLVNVGASMVGAVVTVILMMMFS